MSVTQNEKAMRFRSLHDGPGAFVIPNPWDVGSAQILAGLGFQALATSSAASACALGLKDHEPTRDEALARPHDCRGHGFARLRRFGKRIRSVWSAVETVQLHGGDQR